MDQVKKKQKQRQAVARAPSGALKKDTFRPFALVKNFTYLSIIVIFAGTLMLSVIITQRAKAVLLQKSEAYALLLANNLNHQIFLQFLIPTVLQYGKIQLRNQAQFERIDKVVRGTLHGFNVDMVTIFGVNAVVSYSFEKELVGQSMVAGIEFTQAMEGKSTSKLEQSGPFWAIFLGIPEHSKLRTFAPLFAEEPDAKFSGRVLGVIEIVQDLSADFATTFKFQLLIVGSSTGVMLFVFLFLRFYVKRGEEILLQRAEERLRLEEQLSHAERLASLGEMAAGVSHEIRNPLGIIRSSAQLLKKKGVAEGSGAQLLDVVVEESTRLNDIITDFLEFARPSSPRMQECKVEEVLEKNLSFLSPRLVKDNYEVVTHYAEALPPVMADPNQLYQCFLNILLNAMQAMPEGGSIFIDAFADEKNVNVTITDQGEGLDMAALKRVWNPFFTTKDQGTGLGLSVVRNIIGAHGGNVLIENAPEKGARVWIELPIGEQDGHHPDRG